MKKRLKHYRIVSENGEALLISHKCFQNIMATLDVLAKGPCARQEQERYKKK